MIGVLGGREPRRLRPTSTARRGCTDSPALEGDAAHLRTDAFTSLGVLVGLVLVEVTGIEELDPIVALLVAGAIVAAGVRILTRSSRVLVDEALPGRRARRGRARRSTSYGAPEVAGFHKLRARRAGSRRYIDLHVQFRDGHHARARPRAHARAAARDPRAASAAPTC